MNKKATELPLKPFSELIIAAIIFMLFFYVGTSFGKGYVYQKIRITNEDSAAINTLNFLPGFVSIKGTENTSRFILELDKTSVKLSSFETDSLQKTRIFVPGDVNIIPTKLDFSGTTYIVKSSTGITISDKKNELAGFQCPAASGDKPQKLVIIPENQFTTGLSKFVTSEVKEKLSENTKALLEIKSVSNTGKIKIFFNPNLNSRRFACLIANNLLSAKNDLNISLIPSNIEPRAEIAVQLEQYDYLENNKIWVGISNAFKEY